MLEKSLSSIVILNIELYIGPWGFPGDSMVKNTSANAGDAGNAGLISGWRRSAGEGHSKSLQYSWIILGELHGQEPGGLRSMGLQSDTT